jgi:hypothetical protein
MLNFFDIARYNLLFFEFFQLLFHSSKECVMLIDLDLQGHQGSAILRNGHSRIIRLLILHDKILKMEWLQEID